MTGSSRVGPTERMLAVLALLSSRPTRVWAVTEVKNRVAGYGGGAGDRNWQLDSAALRERGLIKSATKADGRRGVEYAPPLKPDYLHLSVREHDALIQARRARGIAETPTPLDRDEGRGTHLQTLAEALRLLEESGEWMEVGQLARKMGHSRPARLLEVLKLAWFLDVDGQSVGDNVIVIDCGDEDGQLSPSKTVVCVERGDADRPLFGKGLAAVGIGAYTLAETEDRLQLIKDVLAGRVPGDAAVLRMAEDKLLRWQHKLRSTFDPG